jgi:hypothetical protein
MGRVRCGRGRRKVWPAGRATKKIVIKENISIIAKPLFPLKS